MIRTLLIDDEPLARSIVREYLADHADFVIVDECENGFEGVKAIHHHNPDLVFLDIQMPKITGFEMIELLDEVPAIIFTTAYDEYALKAFEAMAVDYLLKPFSKERFDKAISKWQEQKPVVYSSVLPDHRVDGLIHQPEEKNRVVVKVGNNIRIIPVHDIHAIEAYDDYVKIFTKDEYFLKKKTLSYFEEVLPSSEFLRIHRSYIVQLKFIARIEPYEKNGHIVILQNGRTASLSRSGYARLKEILDV